MCGVAFSAGSSITIISDPGPVKNKQTGDVFRVITIKAVGDSGDGSIPDLTLNDVTTGIKSYYPVIGWSIFQVIIDGDHAGAHDGSANAAVLTDTDAGFDVDYLVGLTITNATDSSTGTITANTASTVTATLSGGTDDDWDVGDTYTIGAEPTENSELYIYQNGRDILEAAGVDKVDNTTENSVYCKINGTAATPPVIDDLTVTVTQQAAATNSAVVFLKIILY